MMVINNPAGLPVKKIVLILSFITVMYIIKIKGKVRIPDYVQLRDDKFTLLAYFRADRPDRALIKCGLEDQIGKIKAVIKDMPFGKLQKLELS